MTFDANSLPGFDSLRSLLVEMAKLDDINHLPDMITKHLASRAHVEGVKLWVLKKSDSCEGCGARQDCRDMSSCLHLASSCMRSCENLDERLYSHGRQQVRVPAGKPDPGLVLSGKRSVYVYETKKNPEWLERNPWAKGKGVVAAAYKAIRFKDEVLGVIGIYSRLPLPEIREGGIWVNIVANQAAYAIVNNRSLAQIEDLKSQLELENRFLREEIKETKAFGELIGESPALLNVSKQIDLVAPTDASVLILGESGTGKELVAREIHRRSSRNSRPMIKVNCAAIPHELYESEFFGHVRGAFTGSIQDRGGRFQAADGGTLFLDEVGEIPLSVQGKLLRVLQEGTYERVGEEKIRKVDVRIIAATNRDIKRDVISGNFRPDLYYRLNVFPIEIPPLRLRKDDIPPITIHFLSTISKKMGIKPLKLAKEHITRLSEYDWPGNVRELQNVLERLLITSRSGNVHFDLPRLPESVITTPVGSLSVPFAGETNSVHTEAEIQQLIRENTENALKAAKGRIYGPNGAAALLGIRPTTLVSRLSKRKSIATT